MNGASGDGGRSPQEVRISIPADTRFLRVARLTAAGIASDIGFGLQDLEDLRVAVDELCAVLIDGAPASLAVELRYLVQDDRLEITGHCPLPAHGVELHPVAAELLALTADTYELSGGDSGRSFRLVRRRHDAEV